ILLVSRKGQAIRFRADDTQLRPMGRATSGVAGMKFRNGDSLLSMSVIRAAQMAAEEAAEAAADGAVSGDASDADVEAQLPAEVKPQYVFTITDGGFAKRSRITEYRLQSRGGLGIKAMSLANEDRGGLVGAFIVEDGDEVLSITNNGQVVRSPINADFRPTGRSTMGVKFVSPKNGDAVAVVARSVEAKEVDEEPVAEAVEEGTVDATVVAGDSSSETADAAAAESPESAESPEDATIEGDPDPEGDA
ncbi:MAG: DNA gyrase C-terminal beta-propeller domain-containing protein, partial [Nocardioides sp.]